jgi:hypothetical protein
MNVCICVPPTEVINNNVKLQAKTKPYFPKSVWNNTPSKIDFNIVDGYYFIKRVSDVVDENS